MKKKADTITITVSRKTALVVVGLITLHLALEIVLLLMKGLP